MELHKGKLASEPRKFKVRVAVVKKALEWLLENHPAYANIKICNERLQILEKGLVGANKDQIVLPRMEVPHGVTDVLNLGNMGEQSAPDGKNPFERSKAAEADDSAFNLTEVRAVELLHVHHLIFIAVVLTFFVFHVSQNISCTSTT